MSLPKNSRILTVVCLLSSLMFCFCKLGWNLQSSLTIVFANDFVVNSRCCCKLAIISSLYCFSFANRAEACNDLSLINVLFLPIGLNLAMIFHWSMSVFVDWTEACNDLSRLFAFCQLGLKQIAMALFPMFVVMLHCKSWKPVSTVREFSLKCL